VGDRVVFGGRQRPVDVVEVGTRTVTDERITTEIETPVVKLRGDWEGAREVVLAHQITRWTSDGSKTKNVLRERETIVETNLGREVTPRWTHVTVGDDSGREVAA
jgi:hypothetical protein